jgi:hypothetical protein
LGHRLGSYVCGSGRSRLGSGVNSRALGHRLGSYVCGSGRSRLGSGINSRALGHRLGSDICGSGRGSELGRINDGSLDHDMTFDIEAHYAGDHSIQDSSFIIMKRCPQCGQLLYHSLGG